MFLLASPMLEKLLWNFSHASLFRKNLVYEILKKRKVDKCRGLGKPEQLKTDAINPNPS